MRRGRASGFGAASWRRRVVGCVLVVVTLACCGIAHAQSFPSRPIHLIVPYAPGGAVDIVSRSVGAALGQRFGWTVVVENRTGAGGNIASAFVAKSEPDGYTLLTGSNATSVNGSLYSNLPYDPATDLTPIVMLGRGPIVLVATPSLPVNSVRELVAYAKAHPGTLNFGSGGVGTSEHLTYELFKRRTGIEAIHVPYRGGALVFQALIPGQVQLFFSNQLQAMPHVLSGSIKALAIANPTRSPQLPNVPTMAEEGVPDFVVATWWGMMGPRGLSPEIVTTLNQAVNTVLDSPELTNRLDTMGAERIGGTPAQFADFFKAEMATWSTIIRAEGIKVE
jgi:tripartite-type tricarboxylate transporter receptor subunit TctC